MICCLEAQWAPRKPWRRWGRWEPLPTPTGGSLLRPQSSPGTLQPAPASSDPRAAALREGRGPARRGRAAHSLLFPFDPFKNYSLQIPGLLREEQEGGGGATLLQPRRGPGGRGADGWPAHAARAGLAPVASPGSVRISTPGKLRAPPPPPPAALRPERPALPSQGPSSVRDDRPGAFPAMAGR